MSDQHSSAINVFLKVDHRDINDYFNEHDPSPLYNRQLSIKFEQYLTNASTAVKRYSVVFYKLFCNTDIDKKYAEPLMYAVRKHYQSKLTIREKEFERFKKRTWILLAISMGIVLVCQGFLMLLFNEHHKFQSAVTNIIDVFSWVVLWQPIDQLLFHWNPYLKDISLLRKMATAEIIFVNGQKETMEKSNAPSQARIITKPAVHEN